MLIEISNEINPNLGMNHSAKKLFEKINESSDDIITIDFTNVSIISRTFALEYVSQKNNTDKKIIEENVPDDVKKMFQVITNVFNEY